MQNLVLKLIESLRYLEKGLTETTWKEREAALNHVSKVMSMKMDLSNKIINGFFCAVLNILSEKSIDETERAMIMTSLVMLFETYSTKNYFIGQDSGTTKYLLFTIKLCIDNMKVNR